MIQCINKFLVQYSLPFLEKEIEKPDRKHPLRGV